MGFPLDRPGRDLFKAPVVGPALKDRRVLVGARLAALALLAAAIGYGFAYPEPERNAVTTGLLWGLFWPFLIIVTLPTVGSAFCAVCPLGFMGQHLTRLGLQRRLPGPLRSQWIGVSLLVVSYWIAFYGFPETLLSPRFAAALFLGMTLLAAVTFLVYRRMAFCKSICPVGAVIRAFSRVGFVWLTTEKEDCNRCKTFDCARSCTYHLQPYNFDRHGSMADCTLCMDCAQACDSVRFVVTAPSHSLLGPIPKPHPMDVWIYIVMLGVVTVTMRFQFHLGTSPDVLPWVVGAGWIASAVPLVDAAPTAGILALAFGIGVPLAVALGGFAVAARILRCEFRTVFLDMGYAMAPLMVVSALTFIGHGFMRVAYTPTVNAFIQLLHLPVDPIAVTHWFVDPLLTRFPLFNWLAVAWALYLAARRMRHFDAPPGAKAIAFPFATAMTLGMAALNLQTG